MSAVLFTDAPQKVLKLPYFSGRGREDLEARSRRDLKKALPSLEMAALVYFDVQGYTAGELSRLLAVVAANPQVRFCIVDLESRVDDVASVFHAGAVDYLGKKLLARPAAARREKAVLAHVARLSGARGEEGSAGDLPTASGDGWSEIEPGMEHTFAFLFIEVDDAEGLKQRHEPANLIAAMGTFRGFIERIVTSHGGRLWMWATFGGLALFPLHEKSPQAPVCGLRILLSSIFYDCENSIFPGRLSFRMALSVGSTVYNERETGKIISDAVNSIFHLGRRFARAGQFVITAAAHELVPQPLRALFRPAGTFEGRKVHRMLRPSAAPGVRDTPSRTPAPAARRAASVARHLR